MRYIYIIIFLCSACKVQKELNKQTSQSMSQFSQNQESSQRDSLLRWENANSIVLKNEKIRGFIQIIPLGYFSYTVDSGFKGSAKELIIWQDAQSNLIKVDSQNLIIQQGKEAIDKKEELQTIQQSQLSIHKKIDKKPIGLWTWLSISLLVILFSYGFVKLKKRWF